MADGSQGVVSLRVDGRAVEVPDQGESLLEVLRDRLGIRSPKDGCSPQGQCGCCTVLVDGQPRVACVTPVRRVAGREVTTVDGLPAAEADTWGEAFCATGASQCGFCTPGIIVRLEGARRRGVGAHDRPAIDRALAAHLCRCTGWQTIREAYGIVASGARAASFSAARTVDAAALRATIEGGAPQRVDPAVALGRGGFADDTAPLDALVAVPDGRGGWSVAETLREARARAGKVQGRRTTLAPQPPLEVPPGDWAVTLRTSWVEPAYLETDASWCAPGGDPVSPLANGGAFGGKVGSEVAAASRRLADEHGRPVRVLYAREDTVRLGAKRPPVAGGVDRDGRGVLRVVRTPGVVAAVARVASLVPDLVVEEVEVAGPATSVGLRGAGWVEAVLLVRAAARIAGRDPGPVVGPSGGVAEAEVTSDGSIEVRVACGEPLDEVVLRSYCIGAAHQALSWVTSEGLAVDDDGEVHDLTVRSFGVLAASAMPEVRVDTDRAGGVPVNGSDAVFAAVASAVWAARGHPPVWPTGLS